jgi:hypothetical protein
MNNKAKEALKEYQRKLKAGEIEKPVRKTPVEKALENPKSLRFALNAKCWDCSGQNRAEVGRCTAKDCPLWHHRPWK